MVRITRALIAAVLVCFATAAAAAAAAADAGGPLLRLPFRQ